jgi:hypothetical protein
LVLTQHLHESALYDALGGIEPQHSRSYFANCRSRLNDRTLQLKVFVPSVAPGIEEPDGASGPVDGGDIRPFVAVAEHTSVSQIADTRGAAVFSADNVIDFVRKACAIFMDQTVFTTSLGALDHQAPPDVVYVTSH